MLFIDDVPSIWLATCMNCYSLARFHPGVMKSHCVTIE